MEIFFTDTDRMSVEYINIRVQSFHKGSNSISTLRRGASETTVQKVVKTVFVFVFTENDRTGSFEPVRVCNKQHYQ